MEIEDRKTKVLITCCSKEKNMIQQSKNVTQKAQKV